MIKFLKYFSFYFLTSMITFYILGCFFVGDFNLFRDNYLETRRMLVFFITLFTMFLTYIFFDKFYDE
jgi:hypothetical protein